MEVLTEQLKAELNEETNIPRLTSIIHELGLRVDDMEESENVDELKSITSSRKWVPVTGGGVATTSRALITSARRGVPPGFKSVVSALMKEEGVVEFLELMGCSER